LNMDYFLVSTTSALEGYEIEEYMGPVFVPFAGAGSAIDDWYASFTDFFGGKSRSYQRTFGKFVDKSLEAAREKAIGMGANAIIGVRLETTNLSGEKSMLLIVLYGTAVRARRLKTAQSSTGNDDQVIGPGKSWTNG